MTYVWPATPVGSDSPGANFLTPTLAPTSSRTAKYIGVSGGDSAMGQYYRDASGKVEYIRRATRKVSKAARIFAPLGILMVALAAISAVVALFAGSEVPLIAMVFFGLFGFVAIRLAIYLNESQVN